MPFPSHLLTDVCVVSRFKGRATDAFSTPQYGPKENVRCAYQESFQRVRDTDGNERVAAHVLATSCRINEDDRVWLPTANGLVAVAVDDEDAKSPIAIRNDRSRRGGFRMYQTFF